MIFTSCFVLLAFGDFVSAKLKSADKYLTICHRNDPKVNQCLENAILSPSAQWIHGIPDLKVPKGEPLFIPELYMKEGEGNFNFYVLFSNMTMAGLSKGTTTDVSLDLNHLPNFTLNFTLLVPKLDYRGKYNIDGRILVISMRGKGDVDLNFTSVTGKMSLKGRVEPVGKDKEDRLVVESVDINFTVKGGSCYFGNLFNNNKALSDGTNRFLNENFLDIFEALKHLPEQAFAVIAKEFTNLVFSRFPFDELLPP